MLDVLANISIRAGDYRVAMQVGRAGQGLGAGRDGGGGVRELERAAQGHPARPGAPFQQHLLPGTLPCWTALKPRTLPPPALQAVRALELIGREVDKAKYAALAEEVRARQAAAAQAAAGADADRPRRSRSWAAYQRRREARRRNTALERFKFWLGLPNKYYDASSDGDAAEQGAPSGEEFDGREEWQAR